MTTNVGRTDKMIRLGVALLALVLSVLVGMGSALGVVLLVVAAIMAVTSVVGFCPLYRLVGMNTCATK